MIYKSIIDIPTEGKELIKSLINRGIIVTNNDEINLHDNVYQILIILAKIGLI